MPSKSAPPKPQFFASVEEWRAWLEEHHASTDGLLVGLMKANAADEALSYPGALDEALCFGWIDGRRTSVDHRRWMIRFSPRTTRSIWSAVNIKHVERLKAAGRMARAGLAAFENRDRTKEKSYSFENRPAELDPALGKRFRANKAAWAFFATMPPSYRKTAVFWVMSAKKAETRDRRLAALIEDSAAGRKVGPLRRPGET